jgi:hypothetical protein
MNDPSLPEEYRDGLAALAAPYCHARQATVTRMKLPSEMTEEELQQQITWAEEVVRAMEAAGEPIAADLP